MKRVYVVGVGITPLGKHLDKSVKDLTRIAVDNATKDARCDFKAIEAAWFSNTRQGLMEGQHGIRGQCALRAYGFEAIPIVNTDNACCSSTTGLIQAFAALGAGMYDVALVVGAEKMIFPDKRREMFEAFQGGMDRQLAAGHMQNVIALGAGLEVPPEYATGGADSIFMDMYAALARAHMKRYGTTMSQIAAVAAKNHYNSQFNPLAQYRNAMTVDEVMKDRMISWPITRSMCAPVSDGAGAVILCNEDALCDFDRSRAVHILSCVLGSGTARKPDDREHEASHLAALKAYRMAGIGSKDISFAEVHDATAFAEIIQAENMGFCAAGEGGRLVESGETSLGGSLPINPSGGLLSKGHPVAATGAIQIHELVTQLRGEAGKRQIKNPEYALAENGGGFYGYEEAAVTVTILGKD